VARVVAHAARRAEAARRAAADHVRDAGADAVTSWQTLTGRTAGGHAVDPATLAALRGDGLAAASVAEFESWAAVCDAAVAALYGCDDHMQTG
jgi:voltage-gated potassium channel Kch